VFIVGNMKKRALPATGGGGPYLGAAGIITPPTDGGPRRPLTLSMDMTMDSAAVGRAVVDRVRAACYHDDLDELVLLRFWFPTITARIPEFHALMNELLGADEHEARRIMREPGSVGRPRGTFYFVALVEKVMDEQGVTAKEAAEWLVDNLAHGNDFPFVPGVKRIANLHSSLRAHFDLWRRPIFIADAELTAREWCIPGEEFDYSRFVPTVLPGGVVVFHAPEDKVYPGKPKPTDPSGSDGNG
jgi:hypothetical protein